ncbi:hypothetical protein [Phyllobacterium endophyticum]|jgi:hypothetical protein|uniref:Uncharacterized protein n=1 Tax=Phyllobacterium endophyticum TaxID=1149773 RepID=A0A2P7ALU5_9HYPH|nr:hypothetical protein [Phyllobacterium endophyticum]MBB3236260.1 hypothetical protein [Phyllobacterium endophyticum]PSH55183.1 hypothetical protein CU100_24250 [Phyllobacterium endophyticum]TXR49281.1 hypothetical protein FVA77_09820 [Phyllobacterium endophyticum]TYR39810.1 hypothetical protein FY050_19440 [Phyllobacterium endophyticum]
MAQRLDHKLECADCGTIYLDIPADVTSSTPIHCSSCGNFLGSWGDLEMDFAKQGGQHGIFRMEQGVITRVDDAAQALRSANENKPPMKSDEIV